MKNRSSFKQGLFTPKNPEKYEGDLNKIRYMSSWELNFDHFLDNNPNILRWSSEPIGLPYIKPTDGRVHKYYPDYWVEYKTTSGEIIQEIIEVKPDAQTKPPTRRGKKRTRMVKEQIMYAVNVAKWKSAQSFCDNHNMKFRLVTERQLFR